MIITKILRGEVHQDYDTKLGRFVSQEFLLDDGGEVIDFINEGTGNRVTYDQFLAKAKRGTTFLAVELIQPK